MRRLKHENSSITGVTDPADGTFYPADSAGGVSVPDALADHLTGFPGWREADDQGPGDAPAPHRPRKSAARRPPARGARSTGR